VSLFAHILSVFMATNSTVPAISNEVASATGVSLPLANPVDPEAAALRQVMIDDDAAQDAADASIKENDAFAQNGAGETKEQLNVRLHGRFDAVRKEYQAFLVQYPNSARGHLAYGSFLNDLGEEAESVTEYQKSLALDPKNPAVWNNLANYYGEFSPVTNAFADYGQAIALDPTEAVYYRNLATTVYLFRRDAKSYYHITEGEVFDKSLGLYRQAMQLAPDDLPLATDYAQTFYGIQPLRTNDALMAWTNALNLSHNETEREGVYIHLARIKMCVGRYDEARAELAAVTLPEMAQIRQRLERNLAEDEHPVKGTNSVP
jgi:tetratricopeptide (TPR) repeat protein